jgi:HEAT repeat protein
MSRATRALALGVAAAAVAGWYLRGAEAPPLPAARDEVPAAVEIPVARAAEPIDRERARVLRESLLRSDDALREALRELCDPRTERRRREALAVILGSLPGERGKKALLGALRSGALAGLERAAILGLGIRTLEDGREFARDGMPYALEAAEGLVVYVRDPLRDPDARAEVARLLAEAADPAARRAAALVLRDSASFPEVREALLGRVGVERDSEAAAESAAAVATWARHAAPEEGDRPRIVARIADALPQGDELFRFRLLSPLGEVAMKPPEAARVRGMLESPDPDLRVFAADVLGRRLEAHPGRDLDAVPVLVRTLGGDSSDAVREAAALALGRAPGDVRAREGLARALRSDPDWEVRAAAARALASHPSGGSARALREAVAADPRSEVRQAATRSLADASPR